MSKTPYMPLWVADFLAKTTDLDARETGAYMLLIMSLWTHGGTLPNDQKKLQRIARCGREWPRVWAAIERYFTVSDEAVTQPRVTEELQKVNAKREVNAHNGARGGRAKALKNKDAGLANATNSLKQPEPEPDIKEEETNVSSKKKPPKRGRRLSEDWVLPSTWGQWAIEQGLDENTIRNEAAKFRDYWTAKAGQAACKVDWQATWRNWIRKWKEDHGKPNLTSRHGHRPPTAHGTLFAGFGAIASEDATGGAEPHGGMRDVTPASDDGMDRWTGRDDAGPFLRVAYDRG